MRVKLQGIGVGDGPAGPVLAGPLFQFNDIHYCYPYCIKTVTLCMDVDACHGVA